MEEQIIARLALNAFREDDAKTLLEISSEHVTLLTKVLNSGFRDSLDFLWFIKFEFLIEAPKKALLAAIQTAFDINSSDLFVLPSPIYLSPDAETNFCLLETNIKISSEENVGEGAVAVLLVKESEHWKFHNAIVIKVDLPLEYYLKLGWRDKFESGIELNSIRNQKEEATDQLSLDDYWGSESSNDDYFETESLAADKIMKIAAHQRIDLLGAFKTETHVSHNSESASKVHSSLSNSSDTLFHIYNIIKGTYEMARAQGVSKEMFQTLFFKVMKDD